MGTPASNMARFFWVVISLKISVGDYPSKQAFTPSLALTGHPPGLAKATYGRDVQFFQEDWEVPWEPKKKTGSFAVEKSEKKNTPTSSEIDLNNDISYPTIFGQHKSWIDSIVIHRDLKTILLVATFNDILPVDIIFHYVLPYLYLAATIFLATFRRFVVFQRFFVVENNGVKQWFKSRWCWLGGDNPQLLLYSSSSESSSPLGGGWQIMCLFFTLKNWWKNWSYVMSIKFQVWGSTRTCKQQF